MNYKCKICGKVLTKRGLRIHWYYVHNPEKKKTTPSLEEIGEQTEEESPTKTKKIIKEKAQILPQVTRQVLQIPVMLRVEIITQVLDILPPEGE